jgi:hypothetical protein
MGRRSKQVVGRALGAGHDGCGSLSHEGFGRHGTRHCPRSGLAGLRRTRLRVLAGIRTEW